MDTQDQTRGLLKKVAKRNKPPYWNFWKVILAGWMIRYPKTMAKVVLIPLSFLVVIIYNAVTK
jgi:hypothetical protein